MGPGTPQNKEEKREQGKKRPAILSPSLYHNTKCLLWREIYYTPIEHENSRLRRKLCCLRQERKKNDDEIVATSKR